MRERTVNILLIHNAVGMKGGIEVVRRFIEFL